MQGHCLRQLRRLSALVMSSVTCDVIARRTSNDEDGRGLNADLVNERATTNRPDLIRWQRGRIALIDWPRGL